MEIRNYSWKYGNRFDPNMVGREFEAIEKRDGKLTKKAVVEAARPEDSPMHDMYEWDDAVAGELYRENQAYYYIRTLEVEVVPVGGTSGKSVKTRGFLNVTPVDKNAPEAVGTFYNAQRAIETLDTYKIVLDRAKNQLRIFREQYESIQELKPVIVAIDTLLGGAK